MKISIVGDAYVVTSKIKASQIEALKKSNPAALRLKDDKENDIFAVDYIEGHPSISRYGITFSGVTRDENACLTLTGTIPSGTANAKEFVADVISPVVAYLNKLEESVPTEAEAAITARKTLIDSIDAR